MSLSRRLSSRCRPQGLQARLRKNGRGRILADHNHDRSEASSQAQTSIFLATANAEGQPYIQHRGGPPGFLRVLDERTSASPISPAIGNTSRFGNLAENPKAYLFLIDYTHRRRVKIWGKARVVEGDAELRGKADAQGL